MDFPAILIQIFVFVIFLLIAFRFILKKKLEDLIVFTPPLILFDFFIELMSMNAHKIAYAVNKSFFVIFNIPLFIPIGFSVIILLSFWISNEISSRLNINNIFILSIITGFLAVLTDIILDSVAVGLGWWTYFQSEHNYFIKNFLLGVPIWNYIGWFLATFIFSLLYRILKGFNFKKRIILTYTYISIILIARFFTYLIMS